MMKVALFVFVSLMLQSSHTFHLTTFIAPKSVRVTTATARSSSNDNTDDAFLIPSEIQQPVLRQVYPALLKNINEFGHPNIPLGTTDGKKCKTLRRLYLENKLSTDEIAILSKLKFIFGELEDVYKDADFNDIVNRLIAYEEEHKSNYQIPKKYGPDPALGAWVTMVRPSAHTMFPLFRRLGPDGVPVHQKQKLNDIGFAWKSTRKCGSAFMKNYRSIKEALEKEGATILETDDDVKKWIKAQQQVFLRGDLSETRVGYMDDLLPGFDWREF